MRGQHGLVVGDRVQVRLINTDPVHGFIDFERSEGIPPRKAERTRRKQEWAALLIDRIGERFEAVVTGVTPHATWIRTRVPEVEGRLVRGTRGLRVGDEIGVILLATDRARGWIDFARTER